MIGNTKAAKGFSLTELLVSLAIFTVSLTFIYAIYFSGQELWELERDKLDLQAAARTVISQMGNELRQATRTSSSLPSPNLTIPAAPANTRIVFYLPADTNGDGFPTGADGMPEWDTGNPIEYRYLPASRQIVRIEGLTQQVIANDVEGLVFQDASINNSLFLNEVKIILTLRRVTTHSRDITFTLSLNIKLRN